MKKNKMKQNEVGLKSKKKNYSAILIAIIMADIECECFFGMTCILDDYTKRNQNSFKVY